MNTKFFLITGAALLAYMPFAHAQSYHDTNSAGPMSYGPYMGVQGGYGWTDGDVNGASDVDLDGGDYGVFAGFSLDQFFDRTMGIGLTGALEAQYSWSDAEDTSGGVKFEKNHEWGITFRPGLTFVDAYAPFGLKPYGIIGYRNAEFKASTATASAEDNYDGFELGLGTEVVAWQNYGVRVDYSHVFYGEENGIDPDEDDVRVGLAYHF